jgi:hypothetical protein
MKFLILFSLLLLTVQANARPTIDVAGAPHELVVYDSLTGKDYDSDHGYCKLNGYKHATNSNGSPSSDGPYVILNSKGKVKAIFQSKGNEDRFWTVWAISCVGKSEQIDTFIRD